MRNIALAVVGGLIASNIFAGSISAATVHFSDGFESQSDPLGVPVIGTSWTGAVTGYDLITTPPAPAIQVPIGSSSLRILGSGSAVATGTAGGLVAGNTVEYIFNVNIVNATGDQTAPGGAFNGPVQIALGFNNGSLGTLAKIGTVITNGDNKYAGTVNGVQDPNAAAFVAKGGTPVATAANTAGYDTLRAVLNLTEGTLPGTLGGTYSLYAKIDGGAEQTIGTNLALAQVPIPDLDPGVGVNLDTRPAFILSRGGSTVSSSPFYDDISITSTSAVPEPGMLGLGATAFGMLLARRNRR